MLTCLMAVNSEVEGLKKMTAPFEVPALTNEPSFWAVAMWGADKFVEGDEVEY